MKVDKFKQKAEFRGEEGERLEVYYDNRGEPYREGVSLHFSEDQSYRNEAYVFLEDMEAKELRDLLLKLYPIK